MNDLPRVWGDGVATVAVGQDGMSLWIGQVRVEFVKSMDLRIKASEDGSSSVSLEVSFHHSWEQALSRQIDENVRLVMTIPWVRVVATT